MDEHAKSEAGTINDSGNAKTKLVTNPCETNMWWFNMAKKKAKKREQPQTAIADKRERQGIITEIDDKMVKQAEREISQSNYITPYKLSQKLGTTISIAKKVLRELERQGKIKLYSPGKRDPVYITTSK